MFLLLFFFNCILRTGSSLHQLTHHIYLSLFQLLLLFPQFLSMHELHPKILHTHKLILFYRMNISVDLL